jgi:predicted nucleic-acid-binding protein
MIALDTNALVRVVIEDNKKQAKAVQEVILYAEKNSLQIVILSEVLIETIWVLEEVYKCTRKEVYQFLGMLISSSPFSFPDSPVIREAIRHYKKGGDFADPLIVAQARKHKAKQFFSFDNQLQKMFPNYVTGKVPKAAF